MDEKVKIWLSDAKKTYSAGVSLVRTLYHTPLHLCLSGELGSGKTTFLQGFFAGLGVAIPVTSPSFALEQRYQTERHGEILHIDLHRLSSADARAFLTQCDVCDGICCIEWADRAEGWCPPSSSIAITLTDAPGGGRWLWVEFLDVSLPPRADVMRWRSEMCLPSSTASHCDAVGACAERLACSLLSQGTLLRPLLLRRVGELHDLLRFLDFQEGAGPPGEQHTPAQRERWAEVSQRFPALRHEAACARLLAERGYDALGRIVATHGVHCPPSTVATVEQQLLFYADKRVAGVSLVTLEERFADGRARYGTDPLWDQWLSEAQDIERTLFPTGIPF